MNEAFRQINDQYDKYRISEALMTAYKLIWDDFCSWYLEMIKPEYQKPIDPWTYDETIRFFGKLMQVLHPFMPFVTEEIWHQLTDQVKEDIIVSRMPEPSRFNSKLLGRFEHEREVIIAIRSLRQEKNIPQKEPLRLNIRKNLDEQPDTTFDPVVMKLCNLSEISYVGEKQEGSLSFVVRSTEFFIPVEGHVDVAGEIGKLEKELEYSRGFLNTVLRKLGNERFVSNAPAEVVEAERKKKADTEARIGVIEEQLAFLRNSLDPAP